MKTSKLLKLIAAIILGLMVLFWLFTSIAGILARVPGELNNLIIMIIAIILGFLAWKRLLLGGLLICGFAVLLALYFFLLPTDLPTIFPQLLLMCIPLTLAGLLFIEADWTSKKRN